MQLIDGKKLRRIAWRRSPKGSNNFHLRRIWPPDIVMYETIQKKINAIWKELKIS